MGLFSKNFETLEDLFIHQLEDLYDAESRLLDALPKMEEAAKNPQLKAAFKNHLQETQGQVQRLETAFQHLDKKANRATCDAMKGLISEGEEVLKASGDDDVIDAALIAAAQRVEHYEIAGYGTARNFAERLGHTEVASLLQQTLDEEKSADDKLNEVATSTVNAQAQHS